MFEPVNHPDILSRLERLETENRRLRRILLLVVIAIAPALLVQCSGDRVLTARLFVVEDGAGKTRATLGLEEEGLRLRLFDEGGVRRASLSIAANGDPGLALFDAGDRPGAVLEITQAGPSLVLGDAAGKTLFRKP